MEVEDDGWSVEIDRQTAATTAPRAVISPVASHRTPTGAPKLAAARCAGPAACVAGGGGGRRRAQLSVNAAGDDVRLLLEGGCGMCSSSSVTLSPGIERALRARLVQARAGGGRRRGRQPGAGHNRGGGGAAGAGARGRGLGVEGPGGSLPVVSMEAAAGLVTIGNAGPAELTYGMELYLTPGPGRPTAAGGQRRASESSGPAAVVFAPQPASGDAAQPVASRK